MSQQLDLWNEMQHDAVPDIKLLKHYEAQAKKRHVCSLCGAQIPKGERYQADVLTEDGAFSVEKRCMAPGSCFIVDGVMLGYGKQISERD